MSKIVELLKQIPIYPDGIKFNKNKQCLNFGSDIPLCESDDGFLSWISQEVKDEFLKVYETSQPHARRAR